MGSPREVGQHNIRYTSNDAALVRNAKGSTFLAAQDKKEQKMEEIEVKGKNKVLLSPKEETPIGPIVCLRKADIKRFEETEECFILNFDPFDESLNFSKLSLDSHQDHAADVSINAEKGQVACRDYPHPRHLCVKFPFSTTPHESYCEMCYCCVCDTPAPCLQWNSFSVPHCDIADKNEYR
ncbi:uncharacterized protein LOC109817904 [Cajanus cajan]|uniref:uncharacterized protein LOC109817904 n=1 Tax=Cajanus cajan TaxID=3821 RepID=UPI00098DBE71|nr:uncharacterized protein LOC109817904 [Cajanus cajan]